MSNIAHPIQKGACPIFGYLEESLHIGDSIGSTSTVLTKTDGSTPYTIDLNLLLRPLVSKSIDVMKDVQMNIDIRPVHLYFGRDKEKLHMTPELLEKINSMSHKIIMCHNWDDIPELLKLNPEGICFSYDELNYSTAVDIVNMVRTLSKLVGVKTTIPIAVDISKETKLETVKILQKSEIFGVIPRACDFGWEECEKGTNALWVKIPYWPKHILDQLPGSKKREVSKPGEVRLTNRQRQILDLIRERGASNKVIAKTLNISESTVKLHVGIVLKKFNVKNRTQLALFSKT